jgi:hypothetical protein
MADTSFLPVGDIRYQLLPEIIRLLQEVGNTSNVHVSASHRVLDEDYLKKVRSLITNVYLYVSSAKVTDDESKKRVLEGILLELMTYDDYIRWGRVDYRVLMRILSRIMEVLSSITGGYTIKANLYEEGSKPPERQRRNFKILG